MAHGSDPTDPYTVLAPQWWNDLPVDVRTAEALTTFKRRLKTHLFRLHLSLPHN